MIRLTKSGFENADPQTLVGKWVAAKGSFMWPCFARPILVSEIRGRSAYGKVAAIRKNGDGEFELNLDDMDDATIQLRTIEVVCETNAEANHLMVFSQKNQAEWMELNQKLKEIGSDLDGTEIPDVDASPAP